MAEHGEAEGDARAAVVEDGEALALEAEVRHLVGEDAPADGLQQRRAGGAADGVVVDEGERLHHDHGRRPHLDVAEAVAGGAEEEVAPVAAQPAGAGQVEEAAERLAVALLLADEEVHGGGVVGVAEAFGEAGGGGAEVAAVGGFAELPGL